MRNKICIYLKNIKSIPAVPSQTTAKKCPGGRRGCSSELRILAGCALEASSRCVSAELALCRRAPAPGGIFFCMCDAKGKKRGEIEPTTWTGFVVGMQMHSEAPKRAATDRPPNVAPGARRAGSGTLESVLRPDTGGTGDRDAQPPVEHSCCRGVYTWAWAWLCAVSVIGAAALP